MLVIPKYVILIPRDEGKVRLEKGIKARKDQLKIQRWKWYKAIVAHGATMESAQSRRIPIYP